MEDTTNKCTPKKLSILARGRALWKRARDTLNVFYGEIPDISILNRFYSEKMYFGHKIILWDILGEIRLRAKEKDYITTLPGTLSSCFAAHLLGASDINPLPLHYRCPVCKRIEFVSDKALPWDMQNKPCECGAMMRADGFDIPYEMNLSGIHVSLTADWDFWETAEEIIREKTSGLYRICKLTKPDFSILMFVLLPFDGESDFEKNIDEEDDKYRYCPKITITPCYISGSARKLYEATDIHFDEIAIGSSKSFLSDSRIIPAFAKGDIGGIPYFDGWRHPRADDLRGELRSAAPKNTYDLLKYLGAMQGMTNWWNNAELLVKNGQCSIGDIPSHRDDVFMIICDKLREAGYNDPGIAHNIVAKIRNGNNSLGETKSEDRMLLEHLGLPDWFISYVEKIQFLFPKARSVNNLRTALVFMWYKVNYPEEFAKCSPSRLKDEDGQ